MGPAPAPAEICHAGAAIQFGRLPAEGNSRHVLAMLIRTFLLVVLALLALALLRFLLIEVFGE